MSAIFRFAKLFLINAVDTAVRDNRSNNKTPETEVPAEKKHADAVPAASSRGIGLCVGKGKKDEEDKKEQEEKDEKAKEEDIDRVANILARRWYWRTIAIASFTIGAGCLFFAMNMSEPKYRRRYSRK